MNKKSLKGGFWLEKIPRPFQDNAAALSFCVWRTDNGTDS